MRLHPSAGSSKLLSEGSLRLHKPGWLKGRLVNLSAAIGGDYMQSEGNQTTSHHSFPFCWLGNSLLQARNLLALLIARKREGAGKGGGETLWERLELRQCSQLRKNSL